VGVPANVHETASGEIVGVVWRPSAGPKRPGGYFLINILIEFMMEKGRPALSLSLSLDYIEGDDICLYTAASFQATKA
jgi:hypothetical protein